MATAGCTIPDGKTYCSCRRIEERQNTVPEVKGFPYPKILPVVKINEFRTVVFSWGCSPMFGIALALEGTELGLFSDRRRGPWEEIVSTSASHRSYFSLLQPRQR